jgi:P-type conjugative transfer protein TrbG
VDHRRHRERASKRQADPHTRQADPAGVVTNLVINTDRRTYHMELRSTEKTYMASVSWSTPRTRLLHFAVRTLRLSPRRRSTPLDIGRLRFRYTIEGDNPPWRPLHAFDDGRKVYIEFPRGIAQGEMNLPVVNLGSEDRPENGVLLSLTVETAHAGHDGRFRIAGDHVHPFGAQR